MSSLAYFKLLPPANEVCEGYVFTPVCHSVHRGGVCLSACWDTPPRADTPQEQTPQSRHPWEQTSPQEQTPPGRRHPGANTPPSHVVHAGRYGQQAGGTHPTGMHTCFWAEFAFTSCIDKSNKRTHFIQNKNKLFLGWGCSLSLARACNLLFPFQMV